MKKFIAALLFASIGAGLMAQTLVYDYKASIKRLDAGFKVRTEKKVKFVSEEYKVASDTISGYVTLPICVGCNVDGVESSVGEDFTGYAYLVRKGDKLSKKAGVPYVLKTPVTANAAIFGAYVDVKDEQKQAPRASIKNATKAWMWLDYQLPSNSTKISTKYVLSNVAAEEITLGYLGLTNTGRYEDPKSYVYNTGFGTAKVTSWYKAADLGWCEDGTEEGGSCQYVNTISGTLVGYPTYLGMCGVTPMWDVCYDAVNNTATINDGVICGSWTLKYNAAATKGFNAADDGEEYLVKKLGASSMAAVIDGDYESASSEEEEE